VAPQPVYRQPAGFGEFAPQPAFEAEAPVERPALPLDQPAMPRHYDGQVSYTRGGIGARHDQSSAYSPPSAPLEAGNPARLALVEALGELESARAAIGRVLASRERSGGK
jgi:hypothetical protein